jgi:hypothetical protein
MSAPSSVVTKLAHLVHLMRVAPEARERHKADFRDLQAELADDGLRFSVDKAGLTVGGFVLPAGTPGLGELQDVMEGCGVREIRIPPRVHPALLLALLRALAHHDEISTPQDFIDQFDPAGTGEIQILSGHDMPAADNLVNLPTIEMSADEVVSPAGPAGDPDRETDLDDLPGLMRPTPGDEDYLIGPIQPDPREGGQRTLRDLASSRATPFGAGVAGACRGVGDGQGRGRGAVQSAWSRAYRSPSRVAGGRADLGGAKGLFLHAEPYA